ncbi:hypothetical protein MSBR3_3363 [Methanosarcina barkeri 3]|uniref:DUF1673 domain-containing protein n=1 Tax=Methanosarcina barkeri 3 TaxID=1434107 RepID=A0A0E3SNA3_METBA|nr:DUF1673 domain-containing protein [Methanosarcina barkeri]AKB83941.1 hypothetical protein MSBR3_3363 [Methanosarcina barkeri 3]
MSLKVENIKKFMGWCPNAKAFETGSRNSFANFGANNQSEGEKEKNPTVPGQHSSLDIHLLVLPIIFTPVYIKLFQKGINTEAFLLGLLLSLPIYLLGWKKQMHQYNAVKRNPVVSPSFRKTLACVVLFLFLSFTLLMAFLPYISSRTAYFFNDQVLSSFTSGTLILMWSFYFQLIYWEKKNHMKMYVKREKGKQKLYVLGEKEREL